MKFHPHPFKTIFARHYIILISLLLSVTTLAVYWQVHDFEFVSFDDGWYITENAHVQQGFSPEILRWAFIPMQDEDQVYWHPLTWLSHTMDCQLFGLHSGSHHLMNLFFHIVNVLLLFLALHLMTGAPWKSGFVAALFALHPINVDSVAWISERKNLLSTAFWMLTMLAYIRYTRKPDIFRYMAVFLAMALGLLAKPMLVTLPCVLILLDFWPLGRMDLGQAPIARHPDSGPIFQPTGITRLAMEKIPLLALSIGTIALSVASLQVNNRMVAAAAAPLALRIENAIVSYVSYLGKMIWPVHLTVFYPFPKLIPLWQTLGAAFFLILISCLIIAQARKFPWLATGWLWYVGTLLPVSGLVQGGLWPALADRWAYVPFIGIFIIIAWGAPQLFPNHRLKQAALGGAAAILLCVLSAFTWIQAGYWKTSQTLFDHALKVTVGNDVAHNNLGVELRNQGRLDEANRHYLRAIAINPNNADAYNNMGNSLCSEGRKVEAIGYYERAIAIQPDNAKAHFNLANTFRDLGKNDPAITHYRQAIAIRPTYEKALYNLATLLGDQGRRDEAILYYQQALAINPGNAPAHYNLANAFKNQGQLNQAIHHYRQTIGIQPDNEKAHHNLATALMSQGRMDEAITHYLKALKINPNYVNARYNLGIAYFTTGNFPAAVESFKAALRLNPDAEHIRAALNRAMGSSLPESAGE